MRGRLGARQWLLARDHDCGLGEDPIDVGLHRLFGDVEGVADLRIQKTLRDQCEDFRFTFGESIGQPRGRRARAGDRTVEADFEECGRFGRTSVDRAGWRSSSDDFRHQIVICQQRGGEDPRLVNPRGVCDRGADVGMDRECSDAGRAHLRRPGTS